MDESRTIISVVKRDGSVEPFDEAKLAGALRRGMDRRDDSQAQVENLARALGLYLRRLRRPRVSSTAIFEMVLKALRRVKMGDRAEMIELHRTLRRVRRRLLRVRHDDGQVTQWDKSWVVCLAERLWGLSRRTARILAGEVELDLLPQEECEIPRRDVVDALNRRVVEWGLADAVPVQGVGKTQAE
jgi:hypothetical protein